MVEPNEIVGTHDTLGFFGGELRQTGIHIMPHWCGVFSKENWIQKPTTATPNQAVLSVLNSKTSQKFQRKRYTEYSSNM